MLDVVRYHINGLKLRADTTIALLQPTSPFRTRADLDAAIDLFMSSRARALISVVRSESHPAWMMKVDARGYILPYLAGIERATRRQDLEPVFRPNGAIYLVKTVAIRAGGSWDGPDTLAYEMPRERSLDIDDAWDLALARAIVAGTSR